MVRTFGIACCLVLLTVLHAASTPSATFDRTWWEYLTSTERDTAVSGAISGYQSGYVEGTVATTLPGSSARAITLKHFPKFSHTMGYYAAAVSDFYVTHPEGAEAELGDIIGCLADRPLLGSCADVAKHSRP